MCSAAQDPSGFACLPTELGGVSVSSGQRRCAQGGASVGVGSGSITMYGWYTGGEQGEDSD